MNPRMILLGAALLGVSAATAADWPQWRGPNRDARADFTAPKEWPKELTKKWSVPVGNGVATPALAGDRLYVFTREGKNEVIRCLDAAGSKEVWKDEYEAAPADGPAAPFPGPRSTPAVADGKVVTLGVRGTVSCLDAASGKVLWRKDEFEGFWPRFYTACSPLIVDGLAVVQLGGIEKGNFRSKDAKRRSAVVAYDLASGGQKWRWDGSTTEHASPVLVNVGGTKAVVAMTDKSVVALGAADGKLLWEAPFAVAGLQYNAATPLVDGQTVVYSGSGRGIHAVRLEKEGDRLAAKELWANKELSLLYDSPVLKDGLIYGISEKEVLFCLDAKSGKAAWTKPIPGRAGYGSVVDAGPVLLALTPAGTLTVFEPSDKQFKEVANYKVAAGDTYAYPVVAGNRIYVKDKDAVTLWTVE